MKKNNLFLLIFIILLLIITFFGCNQQFYVADAPKNEIDKTDFGNISLSIINSKLEVRTLIPETFITPEKYDISGAGPNSKTFSLIDVTISSNIAINDLVVGNWTVTVTAKNATGNIIAKSNGTDVINVTKDATSDATIQIIYTQESSGTVDLTIDWPDSVAIDSISLNINYDTTIDLLNGGSSVIHYYNNAMDSGNNTFVFKLKSGGVVFAAVVESVHIYDFLTTDAIITLTADDFNKPPALAPGDLSADEVGIDVTGDKNNKVVLYWVDNTFIETGFVVERKTGSGGTYEVIETLNAGAETFEDLTVDVSVDYYYRVKAFNDFGSSPYSTEYHIKCVLEPPSASDASISGEPVVGQVLTGVYTFSDPNDDSESGSLFQWLISTTSDGTYSDISGATTKNYSVQSGDVGKFIKFEVTPKTGVSPNIGFPVLSSAVEIIPPGDLTTDFDFN